MLTSTFFTAVDGRSYHLIFNLMHSLNTISDNDEIINWNVTQKNIMLQHTKQVFYIQIDRFSIYSFP